jgi:hypothetical protein
LSLGSGCARRAERFESCAKCRTEAADTLGKYLDAGHDWLYPRLQHWFEDIDVRFASQSHIGFDFGVRAKIWPAVFAALRWTPEFHAGALRVYPFAKTYAESGLGFGTSGGIAFEQWSDRWIVRSASHANWVRNTSATDWTQSFIVGCNLLQVVLSRVPWVLNGNQSSQTRPIDKMSA